MTINKLLFVSLFLFLTSCQLPPTKVTERHESTHPLFVKLDQPIVISKDSVILDARAFYDYSMYHLEDSIYIRWQDFLVSRSSKNLISEKQLARKLALKNVHPQKTHVIVGDSSSADFAALAWLLDSLGVNDVQTIYFSYFKSNLTTKKTPIKNAKAWQPKPLDSEFTQKLNDQDLVIDARLESVAFKLPLSQEHFKDHKVINVPWKDFYNSYGRPKKDMIGTLKGINIDPDQSIVVTSSHLSEAAAVTYALKILGYKKIKIWMNSK